MGKREVWVRSASVVPKCNNGSLIHCYVWVRQTSTLNTNCLNFFFLPDARYLNSGINDTILNVAFQSHLFPLTNNIFLWKKNYVFFLVVDNIYSAYDCAHSVDNFSFRSISSLISVIRKMESPPEFCEICSLNILKITAFFEENKNGR